MDEENIAGGFESSTVGPEHGRNARFNRPDERSKSMRNSCTRSSGWRPRSARLTCAPCDSKFERFSRIYRREYESSASPFSMLIHGAANRTARHQLVAVSADDGFRSVPTGLQPRSRYRSQRVASGSDSVHANRKFGSINYEIGQEGSIK